MGTVFIIFDHPPVSCFSHFSQVSEEVQAKHLLAIGFVEALDLGVLVRFSGLDVTYGHAGLFSPCDKLGTDKFGPIINP
jgi:hypothetical protein